MTFYEKYEKHITVAIFIVFTAVMLFVMHPA